MMNPGAGPSEHVMLNSHTIKAIFEEHYESLVSYAAKLLMDPDDRRDAVQMVFVHLFEKKNELAIQSIKPYLYKSVHNKCLQILRSKKTTSRLDSTMYDPIINEDWVEQAEREAEIWKAIDNLPEKCRQIFVMNRFDHLSNDQIARQLHISKRTVETQISLALKRLRKALLFFL